MPGYGNFGMPIQPQQTQHLGQIIEEPAHPKVDEMAKKRSGKWSEHDFGRARSELNHSHQKIDNEDKLVDK